MLRTLKIGIALAAIVAAISIGSFLYLTRGVAAPTEDIQTSVQELATSEANSSTQTIYRISQDVSQVTYTIQEVLNGADKTVVGATSQVAGDILVNMSDPSQSQVGELRINAVPSPPTTPAATTRLRVSSCNPNRMPISTLSSNRLALVPCRIASRWVTNSP